MQVEFFYAAKFSYWLQKQYDYCNAKECVLILIGAELERREFKRVGAEYYCHTHCITWLPKLWPLKS